MRVANSRVGRLGGFLLLVSFFSPALVVHAGNPTISVETYDQLVQAIRQARAASTARIEAAVRQEKVREAWEIGKLIDEHVLHHQERAEYGAQVLARLAGDLGMSHTELKYILQFARTYPISPPTDKLSWGHWRELLSVNNDEERQALAERAQEGDWSTKELRAEIKKILSESSSEPEMLHATPGQPGTYKIIRAKSGPFKDRLMLDLGFSSYLPLDAADEQMEGALENQIVLNPEIRAVPRANPRLIRVTYTDTTPRGKIEDLYTYVAHVINVIDGDTLNAVVDLGFDIFSTQTLRLKGIDAPEIESAAGKEAKAYLEKMLLGGEPILIRTTQSDKYDRYLVDIWAGEQYVNQKLVEEGYAVLVESS